MAPSMSAPLASSPLRRQLTTTVPFPSTTPSPMARAAATPRRSMARLHLMTTSSPMPMKPSQSRKIVVRHQALSSRAAPALMALSPSPAFPSQANPDPSRLVPPTPSPVKEPSPSMLMAPTPSNQLPTGTAPSLASTTPSSTAPAPIHPDSPSLSSAHTGAVLNRAKLSTVPPSPTS